RRAHPRRQMPDDRSAAGADLEAPPAGPNADGVEVAGGDRVVEGGQGLEAVGRLVLAVVEQVRRLGQRVLLRDEAGREPAPAPARRASPARRATSTSRTASSGRAVAPRRSTSALASRR